MTTSRTPGLFARLKDDCRRDWEAYTRHPFVQGLGDATLPLPAFQDYLIQDYLYLVQFARANALAAYTSRRIEDIRASAQILANVLAETELHLEQMAAWGLDREAVEATPEKQTTIAYTRYLLDCGLAGDLLELHVALAPCAIGYAEIGAELAPQLAVRPDHPYGRWIAEYSGEWFQSAAASFTARLDDLAARSLTEHRYADLVTVFRTATTLESAFWQQALDA